MGGVNTNHFFCFIVVPVKLFQMSYDDGRTYRLYGCMTPKNKHLWQPFCERIVSYLKELRNLQGVNLIFTQKKTGFFGMICNIFSIQEIYDLHVEKGTLFYLCTYKFSQDFLEHFFGLMRSKFGFSRNL